MQTPYISICIPAYEYDYLLKRCLNSIISQSYDNYEVVITDDSRHDELRSVVETFNDSRIRYYKNDIPLGSPENWNKSVQLARGEIIKILHHDDWFSDNQSLHELAHYFLSDASVKGIFCNFNKADEKGLIPNRPLSTASFDKIVQQPERLLYANFLGAPSVFTFRRTVLYQFDNRYKWYVDVVYYIHYLINEGNARYINSRLVNVTSNAQTQITNTLNKEKKVQELIWAFERYDFFKKPYYKNFLLFIYIVEVFKKYNIYKVQLSALSTSSDTVKSLYHCYVASKIPFPYFILSFLRRFIIKYI
jgi:glycosyltransferase involved in cell wall biosynthesis